MKRSRPTCAQAVVVVSGAVLAAMVTLGGCRTGAATAGDADADADAGAATWRTPPFPIERCVERDTEGLACARDADCDDGCFCNGTEPCRDGSCRLAERARCDDGVACTVDACFEMLDYCYLIPMDERCSDGDACTGVERCDSTAGCLPVPVPVCDDGDACTVDDCDAVVGCLFSPRHGDPDCAP